MWIISRSTGVMLKRSTIVKIEKREEHIRVWRGNVPNDGASADTIYVKRNDRPIDDVFDDIAFALTHGSANSAIEIMENGDVHFR